MTLTTRPDSSLNAELCLALSGVQDEIYHDLYQLSYQTRPESSVSTWSDAMTHVHHERQQQRRDGNVRARGECTHRVCDVPDRKSQDEPTLRNGK